MRASDIGTVVEIKGALQPDAQHGTAGGIKTPEKTDGRANVTVAVF
jgi:hypothetical protein